MKLKQLLKVTELNQRIIVEVFANGIFYASSVVDGVMTVEDVLTNGRKAVLEAKVTYVTATTAGDDEFEYTILHIQVELCK